MTAEEVRAHNSALNRLACLRRSARTKAAKLGLEGPPLLAKPAADRTERLARQAACQRRLRTESPESFRAADRLRNANPARKVQLKKKGRKRYLDNKSKIIAVVKRWQRLNQDKVLRYGAASRAKLKTDSQRRLRTAAWRRDWERRRTLNDPSFRMLKALRSSLKQALRLYGTGKKTTSIRKLIGCTMAEFVIHIESLWEPWMTWSNHGRPSRVAEKGGHSWVIDHRRPCAAFDMTKPEQQAEAFHWTNLQPLEYFANIRKGSRLDWTATGAIPVIAPLEI